MTPFWYTAAWARSIARRDDAEFQQQVAIKLVRLAAESLASLRRFRQERQILARVAHPGKKAQAISDSTPQAIVTAVCDREPTAPAALNPQLAGDLDNIIRMSIRKEPERRYASAADIVTSLWQTASDGTGLRPVMKGWKNGAGWPESDSSGRWFPSGSYFVFRSRRGKVSSIWALRDHRFALPALFDRGPVQIYSSPLDFTSLAPTPDGKRMFFVARQERRELVRYDAHRGHFVPHRDIGPFRRLLA